MTRRVAFGIGVIAAAALLAACSPVKMGAAAVVGDQRIPSSALDTQVSNLQRDIARYDPSVKITPALVAALPKLVLTQLISFQIRDQTAKDLGVTDVSEGDIDYALNFVEQQSSKANGTSYASQDQMVVSQAVPVNLKDSLGRYYAIEVNFLKSKNGGSLTSTAALQQAATLFSTTECKAAKALDIQVNPQYGQLSFDQSSGYAVIDTGDTLSAAGGAKPVVASPFAPPC